jgi:DNA polymerase I-like protein with 3'-5' exonuclease and polymerase domains
MKLIGFDIESWGTQDLYGLQPWRVKSGKAWLTSFAWATGLDDGAWTHKPTREQLKKFLDACYESGTTIVAWFAPFDVSWLLAYGLREEVYRCKWLDAMLVLKHINNKPSWSLPPHSHGLKQQVSKRWPEHDGYGEDVSFDAVDLTSSMKRLEYNRWDARFTVELCREYLRKLTHPALCNVLIEAACIPMVAEAMLEGVCADIEMARALSYKLSTDAKLAYDNLVASDPDNVTPEVLASPTKLRKLLFKTWAIPTDRKTGAGALSTDSIALTLAARHDPRAKLVRTYRESINNNTKFAQGLIQSLEYNGDGVTRPAPSIFGTYSGRMTYRSKLGKGVKEVPTGIALHQWKREKEFRDTITVPEGYDLIELDADGQEFRWMAVESGDTTMLGLCAPGEDAHSYMGSSIARVDYRRLMAELHDTNSTVMKAAKHLRKLGKFGNLSCQYCIGVTTLGMKAFADYDMELSQGEVANIHSTYQRTYPGVPRYWERQRYRVRRDRQITTLSGRTVYIPDGPIKWDAESTAINFPIQGVGGDQKYLALLVAKNYLPQVGGRFYLDLHDGLFFIVPKAKSMKAALDLRALLSNLPYRQAWGVELPIAFPFDLKIGPSWGELVEVK